MAKINSNNRQYRNWTFICGEGSTWKL